MSHTNGSERLAYRHLSRWFLVAPVRARRPSCPSTRRSAAASIGPEKRTRRLPLSSSITPGKALGSVCVDTAAGAMNSESRITRFGPAGSVDLRPIPTFAWATQQLPANHPPDDSIE